MVRKIIRMIIVMISDYNDIIAPLNKLMMSAIMLHYVLVLRDAIMLHHIVRGVKCYCLEKMTKREGRKRRK